MDQLWPHDHVHVNFQPQVTRCRGFPVCVYVFVRGWVFTLMCISTQALSRQTASLRWRGARRPPAVPSIPPLHRNPTPAASAGAAAVAAHGTTHSPVSVSTWYIPLITTASVTFHIHSFTEIIFTSVECCSDEVFCRPTRVTITSVLSTKTFGWLLDYWLLD